jgi:hypothetical protein
VRVQNRVDESGFIVWRVRFDLEFCLIPSRGEVRDFLTVLLRVCIMTAKKRGKGKQKAWSGDGGHEPGRGNETMDWRLYC